MATIVEEYIDQLRELDRAALSEDTTLDTVLRCITQPLQWLQANEQTIHQSQQITLIRHDGWKKHIRHIYRDILPQWAFALETDRSNRSMLYAATLFNPAASDQVQYHMAVKSLPILIECITDQQQQQRNLSLQLLDLYSLSLRKLCLSANILSLYARLTPEKDCRFFASLICSIPGHLANTFGIHKDNMQSYTDREWFFDRKFYTKLSGHLPQCLQESSVRFIVEMSAKILRQGYEDLFIESVYPTASTNPTFWPIVFEQLEAITSTFQIVKPSLHYVRHKILPNTNIKTASVQLASVLFGSHTTKEATTAVRNRQRVLAFLNMSCLKLSKASWADETLARLVVCTAIQAEGVYNNSLSDNAHATILECTKACFKTWTDPVFIKNGSSRERQFLTIFILVLLAYLSEEDIEMYVIPETRLMSSVHLYFDSGDGQTAIYGALMAESISARIDTEKKLETGLLSSSEEFTALKQLIFTKDAFEQDILKTAVSDTLSSRRYSEDIEEEEDFAAEEMTIDPDAEYYVSDEDDEDDSKENQEDDDDDLQAYYMEEESDDEGIKEDSFSKKAQQKRKPAFVRDLISYLRDQEDPLKLKIGLNEAEQIIRQKAGVGTELSESALDLAKYLITFPESYEIENYRQLQLAALTALIVAVPETVAGFVIDELYDRNTSVGQKQLILGSISSAVRELAGWSSPGNEKKSGVTEMEKRMELISLAEDSLNSKQQVGKALFVSKKMELEKKKASSTQKNRLAGLVGPVFFFPLLVGWWEGAQGRIKYWLGNNQIVAERFILTLTIILHSATNTPDKRRIVKEYFEFALSLRYVQGQSVGVKKALLLGIDTIVNVSYGGQEKLLFYDYRRELEQIKEWLEEILEYQPEGHLHDLAVRIAMRISKIALAVLQGT